MLGIARFKSSQCRAWLLVGLTILLVLAVRVRLLSMPLERDEGEYAYAGQILLQGVPPYREVFNMKLPGTYAAYALIMALFGQTPSAIHLGLALVNTASIVLVFLLGRALLDDTAGVVAAIVFALLSLSPTILGLAGHATHFVLLPALGGLLLLTRFPAGIRQNEPPGGPAISTALSDPGQSAGSTRSSHLTLHYFAGFLLGLAFVMKQHGIFFGLFGVLYFFWCAAETFLDARSKSRGIRTSRHTTKLPNSRIRLSTVAHQFYWFAGGLFTPYMLTVLWFVFAHLILQFWFWTFTYARRYASVTPVVFGPTLLRSGLRVAVGPNLLLWLLPWAGALVMWWDERLEPRRRFYLTALVLCSFASISVGWYFRPHYFILLLPALALLSGEAVSRSLRVLRRDKTLELFLAAPILGLFVFGVLAVVIGNGSMLFGEAPDKVAEELYRSNINTQAAKVAKYIRAHSSRKDRVAVLGSEPEIYFEARRPSATGFIYMYPLMEPQPYAGKMQEDLIAGIERVQPEYAVYVNDNFSWHRQPDSLPKVDDWWKEYWPQHYEVATTFNIEEFKGDTGVLDDSGNAVAAAGAKYFLVLKRKDYINR